MKVKVLDTVDSTQKYLMENYSSEEDVLVMTKNQTQGRGRRGNVWVHFENALAFSFTFTPAIPITLTSLEIAVLIQEFFLRKNISLKLKWPNDILTLENKKCGGILIQSFGKKLCVGVGLNLFSADDKNNYGYIFSRDFKNIKLEELCEELTIFMINNRWNSTLFIEKWNKNCVHLNMPVKIEDEGKVLSGRFLGIGPLGQALMEDPNGGQPLEIFNGSLFF